MIRDDLSVLGRKHSRTNEKTYFGSTMAEDVYTECDSFPGEKHHTVSQPIWKMIKLSNHIISMHWFSVFSTRKTKSGKLFSYKQLCNCYAWDTPTWNLLPQHTHLVSFPTKEGIFIKSINLGIFSLVGRSKCSYHSPVAQKDIQFYWECSYWLPSLSFNGLIRIWRPPANLCGLPLSQLRC